MDGVSLGSTGRVCPPPARVRRPGVQIFLLIFFPAPCKQNHAKGDKMAKQLRTWEPIPLHPNSLRGEEEEVTSHPTQESHLDVIVLRSPGLTSAG